MMFRSALCIGLFLSCCFADIRVAGTCAAKTVAGIRSTLPFDLRDYPRSSTATFFDPLGNTLFSLSASDTGSIAFENSDDSAEFSERLMHILPAGINAGLLLRSLAGEARVLDALMPGTSTGRPRTTPVSVGRFLCRRTAEYRSDEVALNIVKHRSGTLRRISAQFPDGASIIFSSFRDGRARRIVCRDTRGQYLRIEIETIQSLLGNN